LQEILCTQRADGTVLASRFAGIACLTAGGSQLSQSSCRRQNKKQKAKPDQELSFKRDLINSGSLR